jgi:RNA polymerase sigma-70 factor (ECF subfamily)
MTPTHKKDFPAKPAGTKLPDKTGGDGKDTHSIHPDKWVTRYGNLLYKYCLPRINDSILAEDLVQDTFLSALKSLDTFRGEASEKSWLFTILRNKIIDHYRKKASNPATTMIPDLTDLPDGWFTPEGKWVEDKRPREWNISENPTDRKELQRLIDWCKAHLKELQQQVFTLKYLEELDSGEICKVLGISTSNYWILLHRIRLQMRECIERNWLAK